MIPDLHPEELFDKAQLGTLTPSEQAALEGHLAQCAACRFEHQVAIDFAAMPLPSLDVDSLVSNALTARATENLRPRRARRGGGALAIAVVLFAFGSFAAVGSWSGVLPKLIAAVTASPAQAPESTPAPRQVAPVARPLELVSPPPVVEAPPPMPQLEPQPRPSARPAARVVARSAPTPDPVQLVSMVRPAAALELSPAQPELPAQTASSVFEAANRARLAGDRPLAVARYEQILATWPRSPEAAQTQATLGRLMLDRGDPSSALEHLEAYLAGPETRVREEVLGARAQALMHLGRGADEARAWNDLLAEYPLSIHAKRAHARLERLTAAP
jgi:Putative zinc-finger